MSQYLDKDYKKTVSTYLEKHQIDKLLKGLITELVIHRPKDVLQFMMEHLARPPVKRICIIGPPTSGVRQMAKQIAKEKNCMLISSNDIIQKATENVTELGRTIKTYMSSHQYIPDDIMNTLMKQSLDNATYMKSGYVLEGYPLTKGQLQFMQLNGFLPDDFIFVSLDDETLVQEVSQLKFDPIERRSYRPDELPLLSDEKKSRLQYKIAKPLIHTYTASSSSANGLNQVQHIVETMLSQYTRCIVNVKNAIPNARYCYLNKVVTHYDDPLVTEVVKDLDI